MVRGCRRHGDDMLGPPRQADRLVPEFGHVGRGGRAAARGRHRRVPRDRGPLPAQQPHAGALLRGRVDLPRAQQPGRRHDWADVSGAHPEPSSWLAVVERAHDGFFAGRRRNAYGEVWQGPEVMPYYLWPEFV